MTLALTIFAVCVTGGAWATRRAARAQKRDDAGWTTHLVTIAAAKLDPP